MRPLLLLALLAPLGAQEVIRSAIGVTRSGRPIASAITAGDLDFHVKKTRILLVGGLDGSAESVKAVEQAVEWFHNSRDGGRFRGQFLVSAVPDAGFSGPVFPPTGDAYAATSHPEAMYLWRWIGMHAPDLVVEVSTRIGEPDARDLISQLPRGAPSGTGPVPAVRVPPTPGWLRPLLQPRPPSAARREIQRRLARSPAEVARQLAVHYGHQLDEVAYIPAVAVLGRLRLGELADVERIVAPYFIGTKPSMPVKPTGSHFSGHLLFGELARITGKPRYVELARAAADFGFDERGNMREAMPFHSEMSDAVFMGCPILAQAGRLTGEAKYYDMLLRHLRFMLKLNLRPDGLHRHSPLDEAAWGRGNGFPALGLALSLGELPKDHASRPEILAAFRAHMAAVLPHQDPTGAWRQVIDRPESYRELTATAMIAYAMSRGIREGWLERARYQRAVDRAWYAVKTRVATDGSLVDVCTGTGKQKSLRDYYDRTAILGLDPRGGAMALLIATEMAGLR